MSRIKRKKNRTLRPSGNSGGRKIAASDAQPLSIPLDDAKERYFGIFVAVVLLVFGAYQSIQYYGHQVVPNSDFPAFIRTGKSLLAFELPASFKRAPVLGLLQAVLSRVVGGQHPDLTAGWLLNSLLHPFSVVLLYLIARKILKGGGWLYAIIVAVNPWTVSLLVEPIAETTMIFFILLTVYFILRRSNWCYLFASIATMTRYECAALILGAFMLDIITRTTKKERIRAFSYSALASVPLGLWLLGTKLAWQPGVSRHYFGHFTSSRGHVGFEYFRWFWETAFMPLVQLPAAVKAAFVLRPATSAQAASVADAVKTLSALSQFAAATGCLVGIGYSMIKRRWKLLPVIIFFGLYVGIHSMRALTRHRYCLPAVWVGLLLCCYGWQKIWKVVNRKNRIPRSVITLLQMTVVLVAGIWLFMLSGHLLGAAAKYSPTSRYLPYVAAGVILLVFVVRTLIYKTRYFWRDAVLSVLACLMVFSGQFVLVQQVGTGKRDVEFKMLADWYVQNARPGEKLAATLTNVMRFYAPKQSGYFVPMETIGGDDAAKFVRKCHKRDITYIAWDSRIGLSPTNSYYKKWGIDRIAMLARPQSTGPYEFITQLKYSNRRYINLFRLRKPDSAEPD
ncbi:MAG TPA: hypothetical protein HPP87_02310 [Planctomycetes bacterium]|nr:hypothetical protein [Planctomycetota bacterium]HIJ70180.1 hypothetical protein [Planctomycetota bacterium]